MVVILATDRKNSARDGEKRREIQFLYSGSSWFSPRQITSQIEKL